MDFVAIDVETANADVASICQIGAVRFINGKPEEEWKTYIDPEDYFDEINISIHGINETTVKGSPTFPKVADTLGSFLKGTITVCHTHFDRSSITQAAAKHALSSPDCIWLDSARVARRTWSEFSTSGYGLHNVCHTLGYKFKHHDALEDAKAAGHIIIRAIEQSGIDLQTWLKRVEQPIGGPISQEGNPEGPFFGEVIVFTGALEIPRREAATMAARIGCTVDAGVTKKTTILVVGDQDVQKLAGNIKSSKHQKAEQLILKGQAIKILRESDFQKLVEQL